LRTILILFTALFILSIPVSGQENQSDSKSKEKQKTRKHGQKEEKEDPNPFPLRKLEFGLNFGAYFANKYSANFYNGSPENVNNIDALLLNSNYMRDIRLALGVDETDTNTLITVDGYPTNMHYKTGFMGGLFLRYNFSRKNSIFLEANYAMLRAADVVTLLVYNPLAPASFADYRMEQVIGKEGRVLIDIGYQRSFPMKSRINLFIQGAFTICYTQMIKSIFVVEGKEFNLVNIYGSQGYQPGYNQQTLTVNQNAFGFGGYLGVGAGIPLTAMFGIEPGFFAHYYPTNLEGYPDFKPSFGLYLRILLNFGATDDD
jgi:hypothetical protein